MSLDRVIIGDCRETLRTLGAGVVQCCVTSPPYWGLRDYGCDGQIGLEQSPAEYVEQLVAVFREVRRALADDGTLWLNLGDSYVTNTGQALRGGPPSDSSTLEGNGHRGGGPKLKSMRRSIGRPKTNGRGEAQVVPYSIDPKSGVERVGDRPNRTGHPLPGFKNKDLVGIPWRVAFALQADGWWLRSDIVWAKPSPMPESVTDRPTRAHEFVFLFAKSERYFYDADAIKEKVTGNAHTRGTGVHPKTSDGHGIKANSSFSAAVRGLVERRNARSVWTIASHPYSGAHFATMPPALVSKCISAGSRIGDTVLDPFLGSGTVGMVAQSLGRHWLGCELNPTYKPLIDERTAQRGLLAGVAE